MVSNLSGLAPDEQKVWKHYGDAIGTVREANW